MNLSRNRLNSTGESRHPCLTPRVVTQLIVKENCNLGGFKNCSNVLCPALNPACSSASSSSALAFSWLRETSNGRFLIQKKLRQR